MENTMNQEMVKEFVGSAHGDFQKVQELLEKEPGLLNSAWDWGNGDWETAIGAAAHMGRKLDKIEIVRAYVTDNPSLKDSLGPHQISLMKHAQVGDAQNVISYLDSLN